MTGMPLGVRPAPSGAIRPTEPILERRRCSGSPPYPSGWRCDARRAQTCLRSRVGRSRRPAGERRRRAGDHNGTTSAAKEMWHGVAGRIEKPRQIDGQTTVPRLALHRHDVGVVPEHAGTEIGGVREKPIEAAVRGNRVFDQRSDRVFVGNVETDELCPVADGVGKGLPTVFVDVTDNDLSAGGDEVARRLCADAGGPAGDHNYLLIEFCHTFPLAPASSAFATGAKATRRTLLRTLRFIRAGRCPAARAPAGRCPAARPHAILGR